MTHDPLRLAAALLVVGLYLAFCAAIALGVRRRKDGRDIGAGDPDGLLIAYASQTGFAEELARSAAAALSAAGAPVAVTELGALTAETLQARRRVLFVVATTGDGEAPDPAARFARTVMPAQPDLSALAAGVLALGDRSYADFCGFGRRLDAWLADCGAQPLFPRIEVDAGDPVALAAWRAQVAALQPGIDAARLEAPPPDLWRLAGRTCLNPAGVGDPAFLVALEPPAGITPTWHAGDVVEIEQAFAGVVQRRDYSIASLPQDGRIELVVRRRRGHDGAVGLMSGWLTGEAAPGTAVRLRIRANSSFHAAAGDPPMILVGAGTGLAGLRAHLKAHAAAGRTDAWLVFGERTRAGDLLLADEILGWREAGVLSRLDLAFSREPAGAAYVQDVLAAQAAHLREHLARGAAIYVCGSHAGMGEAVHATLESLLGADALEALIEAGRYRRDTY